VEPGNRIANAIGRGQHRDARIDRSVLKVPYNPARDVLQVVQM
jgi:hypothetical protein